MLSTSTPRAKAVAPVIAVVLRAATVLGTVQGAQAEQSGRWGYVVPPGRGAPAGRKLFPVFPTYGVTAWL